MSIEYIMDRWAAWKVLNESGQSPGRETTIARYIRAMRKSKCPKCLGEGQVKSKNFEKTGKKKICEFCRGRGRITPTATGQRKINPSLIHSTKPFESEQELQEAAYSIADSLAERVNILWLQLPEKQRKAIYQEYCEPGKRKQKAERIEVSYKHYWTLVRLGNEVVRFGLAAPARIDWRESKCKVFWHEIFREMNFSVKLTAR